MKKRIYYNFLVLILLSALLLVAFVCVVFYVTGRDREIRTLKTDTMVTVIEPDGTVLLDNNGKANEAEDYLAGEEFAEALRSGRGEAVRNSGAGGETYYYAVRQADGSILRVAKTLGNLNDVFLTVIPAVILVTAAVLIFARYMAKALTTRIIKPLTNIDLEGDNEPVYDELIPYVRKIDRQKQELANTVADLKRRADTIGAITRHMKEGLILISPSGGVLMANNSAVQIFGDQIYSEADERNILHIYRDIAFQQCVKICLSGTAQEIRLERDGKVFDVFLNPVRGEGAEAELSGGVILFFDITEKQAAENQRKEFSANVSHELKTPLTTISALAEMMGNGMAKAADIKEFAEKITDQCRRLINIIEGVIRLSSFDEGKVEAELCEFNLYELAASVAGVLRPKAEERSVAVEITGDRFNIYASRYMIDEMLYNLIENAIKYNKEKGGVTVRLVREGGFCKISVSDTGIGIPPEDQPHVFERFYRADKSRSKKTGGAGLGLSIVKHIAALHGGKIELHSVPDEGTTITCRIPIQAPGSRL
ncbi:MAG: hypothetical protein LBS19_02535 [Clostridiales bacterium]|jgi:two-component system phosphate regulon sensor histidine kinase PhoR|nr:hypothetical protein [Clostridiales bacterium]